MRFDWSEDKNEVNRRKHGISFETATLVFDDPYALTQIDAYYEGSEERFTTIGAVGPGSILFVVHTTVESREGEVIIRLISARPAGGKERKSYAQAHNAAKARDRRSRRKTR